MRIKKKRGTSGVKRYSKIRRNSHLIVVTPSLICRILGTLLGLCFFMGLISFLFFRQTEQPRTSIIIKVYNHREDRLMVMDMEEYLVGVVAGEMPASYELEALKAQAVAARTYAYHNIIASPCGRMGADVCTDSGHCQAYCDLEARKEKWGGNFENYENKIKEAVYATAGEIMVYDGEPIEALYHSTSGGRTEDVENVYKEALPYLRGVSSPGEEDAPRYTRIVTISASAFVEKLKAINDQTDCKAKTLKDSINDPVRFGSGRVDTIEIGGISFTGKQISKAFGLSTTYFHIDVKSNTVTITTHGYGHGVGMSQVGANAMAEEQHTYKEILLHYYTGVEIQTL